MIKVSFFYPLNRLLLHRMLSVGREFKYSTFYCIYSYFILYFVVQSVVKMLELEVLVNGRILQVLFQVELSEKCHIKHQNVTFQVLIMVLKFYRSAYFICNVLFCI